jgi:tetratricopeptide (TPR) repeat protein
MELFMRVSLCPLIPANAGSASSLGRALVLLLLVLLLPACAKSVKPVVPANPLFPAVTRAEAEALADRAVSDPQEAMRAAAAYVFLVEHTDYPPPAAPQDPDNEGPEPRPERFSKARDAVRGRAMAELAVKARPGDGTARYLLAYLAGLCAEANPWNGLDLVPVIEQEALQASRLNPAVDSGGPDRALGWLYLRAPGPPLSLGDSEKALKHFRRAVELAPGHAENRLGLAQALLAEEEPREACAALAGLFEALPPADPSGREPWEKGLAALKKICSSAVKR